VLAAAAVKTYLQAGGNCGKVCINKNELSSCLQQLPKVDLSCLVKGSRSSQMEQVVEKLINSGI
jgi:UDP-N-acetylmuramyl pentapeptide synthase